MKLGFRFNPADYPSLAGYAVANDVLDFQLTGDDKLMRRVLLTNQDSTIRVVVVVSRVAGDAMDGMFAVLGTMSDRAADEHFVSAVSAGIALGDKCLVGPESNRQQAFGEIAFRRQNVFVDVADFGEAPKNLLPLASAIDEAIRVLPDVTQSDFSARRPLIRRFDATSTRVRGGDKVALRLKGAPRAPLATITKTYVTDDGDVAEGAVDAFIAGGNPGPQTLRVVVSTPELLFDVAQIEFTVTD